MVVIYKRPSEIGKGGVEEVAEGRRDGETVVWEDMRESERERKENS